MKSKKSPGRPRVFDTDAALECAMQVFWRKGYEGASLSDLTRSMGINRPSLYAAFGNKKALFHKALERYNEGPAAYVKDALKQPTARAFVEHLLRGAADLQTDPRTPPGCLMVLGALACGEKAFALRKELNMRRAAGEAVVRKRLEQAQSEGNLPADANPADLARYVVTVIQGMAVQAVGGATRADLEGVIRMVLRAWPK